LRFKSLSDVDEGTDLGKLVIVQASQGVEKEVYGLKVELFLNKRLKLIRNLPNFFSKLSVSMIFL
jgi:hypothetical protein